MILEEKEEGRKPQRADWSMFIFSSDTSYTWAPLHAQEIVPDRTRNKVMKYRRGGLPNTAILIPTGIESLGQGR